MIDPIIILIVEIALIIVGSGLFTEALIRGLSGLVKRAGGHAGLARSIREGFTLLWIILAGFGILSVTGIASAFSFLTFSGIVGLTASLALQNTLSNIISGVLLLSDGVLRLDDSVEYSGVKGVVVKIGLRATWVKTEQGDIAVISNNYLVNGPLVNHTATQRLERKLHF
ncbi:MAG TPA: mechanosensitive ion channel domain-containing protein [Candidatus Angelobacter sp.]|nr:mechanosensitive ion channel domain-containing protein [Candidatus Angelobacter sp.]